MRIRNWFRISIEQMWSTTLFIAVFLIRIRIQLLFRILEDKNNQQKKKN